MKFSRALLSGALLTFSILTPAHAVEPAKAAEFKVSRPGDMELTCLQLSKEAARMQGIIANASDSQENAEMQGHGITAATGIGGFLIGTVTGGIGFAAAGLIASEAIDSNVDDAEDKKDQAAQRRSFLVGIYQAKECTGPIEHVLIDTPEDKLADISPAAGELGNRTFEYND